MSSPSRVKPWAVAVVAIVGAVALGPGRAASTAARPTTDVGGTIAPGTVWSAAGSPYRTTANIVVPAGVTLVIEAGVEVRMGGAHRIDVAGAVKAVGTRDAPIIIAADNPAAPWNSIILEAASGPSEFRFVHFSGNGVRPSAMLDVRTSDVVVSEALFEDAGGTGLDITDASPRVERSVFRNAGVASAMPPGALRIRGASDPVIVDNLFQSNQNAPVYLDANASPTMAGNRFEFNGWNGVRLAGSVKRAVTLPSLGPRRWSYWVDPNGITIRDTGVFTVAPGTTLEFISNGMRVEGTLRIMGSAGSEVVMTTASLNPAPGRWRDIEFSAASSDYDPATGAGSIIQHAVLEYGGSVDTGVIRISAASPRIANTVIRDSANRGISVTGNGARPVLVGNLILGLDTDPNGVGLYTAAGAEAQVSFSIFQDNGTGIETDAGANPTIGPLNRFDRNLGFGVLNRDALVCVAAEGNDWTDPTGPFDPSPRDDSCGLGDNPGAGDVVSDNVDYQPWAGDVDRPLIVSPRCGTQRSAAPLVEGWAPPESKVTIYDNFEALGETTAAAGTEALAPFSFQAPEMAPGSHVLVARAEAGDATSGISDFVGFSIDPSLFIDPLGMFVRYDLDGIRYTQPLYDPTGCANVQGGEWDIRVHPDTKDPNVGATTTLHVPIDCSAGTPEAALGYGGATVAMAVAADGVASGTFEPGRGGILTLDVTCGATRRSFLLGTVSVEYDGFVYNAGSFLAEPALDRIEGATVSLFTLNATGANWILWDADAAFGQTNPQVTGPFGWYGFYPPPGTYRVEVTHPDYPRYVSPPVAITSQPFMVTVGLRKTPALFLPALRTSGPR